MYEVPIDRIATPELESVQVYGPSGDKLDETQWSANIGDAPIGFPVRVVFQELGLEFKSKLYEGYELWFVPHYVSLIRRGGLAEVVVFGMEVEYLNERRTCSVVSLFPAPESTVYGDLGLKFEAETRPAESLNKVLAEADSDAFPLTKGAFRFGADTGGSVRFRYSATVSTPKISAVGLGSRRAAWEFKKDKEPLFGRDIQTWSLLALPKLQEWIIYRLRFYVALRAFLIATWREGDSKQITCHLNHEGLRAYERKP